MSTYVMVAVCIAMLWAMASIGVTHFCVMTDAWGRTCRDRYMPVWMRDKRGYVTLIVLSPVGFFVAMYYVDRMVRKPAAAPEWVQKIFDTQKEFE